VLRLESALFGRVVLLRHRQCHRRQNSAHRGGAGRQPMTARFEKSFATRRLSPAAMAGHNNGGRHPPQAVGGLAGDNQGTIRDFVLQPGMSASAIAWAERRRPWLATNSGRIERLVRHRQTSWTGKQMAPAGGLVGINIAGRLAPTAAISGTGADGSGNHRQFRPPSGKRDGPAPRARPARLRRYQRGAPSPPARQPGPGHVLPAAT